MRMDEIKEIHSGRSYTDSLVSREEIQTLLKHVRIHGWQKGFSLFLNTVEPSHSQAILSLTYEENAGWKYLLDLSRNERVLNLETGLGGTSLSLSKDFRRVYCAQLDEGRLECIRHRKIENEADNIEFTMMEDIAHWPYADDYFDAVVCHQIEEWLPHEIKHDDKDHSSHEAILEKIIQEAYRVLNNHGLLFLSLHNKWSYAGLLNKRGVLRGKDALRKSGYRFSISHTRRMLNRLGFKNSNVYFVTPSISRIEEVSNGSMAYKPIYQINLKESVKRLALSHKWFNSFSPGFICIGGKAPYTGSVYRMVNEVGKKENNLDLKRYRIMRSNKVILELASRADPRREKIVKIPLGSLARQRCDCNAGAIMDLNSFQNALSSVIPSVSKVEYFGQYPIYIEGLIQGIALDTPVPSLDGIVCRAAELLLKFHQESAKRCCMEGSLFDQLIKAPMDTLKGSFQLNHLSDPLEAIEALIRKSLFQREIPIVWQHGDFKLENLLVHPTSFQITGVIDWDLSIQKGLPFLDLFHLLVHRNRIHTRRPTHEVILDKVLSGNLDIFERELIHAYARTLGVPLTMIPVLSILYWVYHIVFRITSQPKWLEWWIQENITKSVERIMSLHVDSKRKQSVDN